MIDQCFPFFKDFEICAFKERNAAKLKIIHIPTKKERKFDCVHSVTTIPMEKIDEFKTDPEFQKAKIGEMKMLSKLEYKKYGVTCENLFSGVVSYAQGLSELSENIEPSQIFDQLIELDKMTSSSDYSLNSDIARFVTEVKPDLKGNYLSYLKIKHAESLEKKDCRGIITDTEKFFGDEKESDEREKSDFLYSVGCFPCKEKIYLLKYLNPKCYNIIKSLDLSGKKLKELPKEIWNLNNLQHLNLNSNKLTELPKEIGNLNNLQILQISYNKLKYLPKEIGNLSNLKNLFAPFNQIEELPEEITNLSKIENLYLYNNQLKGLPKKIDNLGNLEVLNLSYNQLTELSKEFGYLKNLRILALSNNNLTELPKEIGNLKNLQILDLNGNKLKKLPKEICEMNRNELKIKPTSLC